MSVLGGIGYILSLIPIANLVAPVLIGIAWLRAGSKTGQTVFKATGSLMIVNFLITLGLVVFLFGSLLPLLLMLPFTGGVDFLSPESFEQMFGPNLFGIFGIVAVSGLVLAVLSFVTFVLEIVSHFRAATVLNSRWFRRAAWMRITLVIVLIVIV
ncbi:MAG: hypothetical protein NZ581_09040, partial [Candidatus Caldarchaeum sp.]|nr:hypothetical protein [Candidatus Caldarchaeum sp.]MDW8436317.1 hypothetical protein [Candidatus Caldarchaeum sp.]